MSYTVLWKPAAEAQLADLWNAGPDRGAIASAADEIDARLKRNPQAEGEDREEGRRILIIPPLAVIFKVYEPDRTVWVSDVWRWNATP
jgi:hypothetical protein